MGDVGLVWFVLFVMFVIFENKVGSEGFDCRINFSFGVVIVFFVGVLLCGVCFDVGDLVVMI